MNFDAGWLRCKASLKSAVRIDATRSDAWLKANEQFAIQTLSTQWNLEMGSILLSDLVEKHIGLHVDYRLPNPQAWRTDAYYVWLATNRDRLRQQLRTAGEADAFNWLRRQFLQESAK